MTQDTSTRMALADYFEEREPDHEGEIAVLLAPNQRDLIVAALRDAASTPPSPQSDEVLVGAIEAKGRDEVIKLCINAKIKLTNIGGRSDDWIQGFDAGINAFIDALEKLRTQSSPQSAPVLLATHNSGEGDPSVMLAGTLPDWKQDQAETSRLRPRQPDPTPGAQGPSREAIALMQEIADADSHGKYGRLAREAILALAPQPQAEPVALELPSIPDDDADFTPDLARKIIAKYQQLLRAQQPVSACREALLRVEVIEEHLHAMRSLKGWRMNLIRENLSKLKAALALTPPSTVNKALDCGEFMPLSLVPLTDPNHDPGEHQVMDAETAYVFKIQSNRERAERIIAALNAAAPPSPVEKESGR